MAKIREFIKKYESKIVLLIGLFLIAGFSFEGGYLQGQKNKEGPIVIEKIAENKTKSNDQENSAKVAGVETSSKKEEASIAATKNCAFVGSKNSNKYHVPTCRWAKNIKPENLVCFASAEDAQKRGYQPDKSCIK